MKKWYTSKTLWVNFMAGVAVIVQAIAGVEWLDPEVQGAIIVLINLALRIFTKTSLGK